MCLGGSFPISRANDRCGSQQAVFDESNGTVPCSLEAAALKVDRVDEVCRLPHREAKRANARTSNER
jgi:hypothetical protein